MPFDGALRLRWADFPHEEYQARVVAAQRQLRAQGVDVLVLVQRQNVEYFSGLQVDHWDTKSFPTAAVVLHPAKDPVLILPRFFGGSAHCTAWIDDVVNFPEPHAAPRDFARVLVETVRRLGGRTARVAVERGTHLVPNWNLDDYEYLRRELGGEPLAGADVIWAGRTIKSSRELDRMRWLTSVSERSVSTARASLSVGTTESEIGARVSHRMIELGAEGPAFRNIRAGRDRYLCSDSPPQDRPIGEGEMLVIDTGAKFRSYVADIAYVAHIGRATPGHHRLYDIVVRAQEAAIAAIRPGAIARDVYGAAAAVLQESGLPSLDMIGHGIGMDIHEPPMLTPYADAPLSAGMVLAVEPWLYDPTGLGVFCVEELVLVTDSGAEVLSTLPRDRLLEVR